MKLSATCIIPRGRMVIAILALYCLLAGATSTATPPSITCPPGTVDAEVGQFDIVSVNLPVAGADSVTTGFGAWSGGTLRFPATRAGKWRIAVIAWGGASSLSCTVDVNVSFTSSSMPEAQASSTPSESEPVDRPQ